MIMMSMMMMMMGISLFIILSVIVALVVQVVVLWLPGCGCVVDSDSAVASSIKIDQYADSFCDG